MGVDSMNGSSPVINSIRDMYWQYKEREGKEPTTLIMGQAARRDLERELGRMVPMNSKSEFMGMKVDVRLVDNFIGVQHEEDTV